MVLRCCAARIVNADATGVAAAGAAAPAWFAAALAPNGLLRTIMVATINNAINDACAPGGVIRDLVVNTTTNATKRVPLAV
jgi:hypothetical protein